MSELTELPFAAVLIGAFWAYQRRRFWFMAILIAISPLGRPEGLGFVLLAAALVLHRRRYWLAILPIPFLLWSYCGWVMWGRPADMHWWQWVIRTSPYSPSSAYGRGTLLHFVALLPAVTGPLIFPFTAIGAVRSVAEVAVEGEHRLRRQLLIAAIPLLILIGHSLLWWQGLMASSGELRDMLVVAPFWALLGAKGWEWVWQRRRLTRPLAWAAAAVMLPLLANVIYPVVPLKLHPADRLCQWFAQRYRADVAMQRDYPCVMRPSRRCITSWKTSARPTARALEWGKQHVRAAPPGTVLLWDWTFALHNADRNLVLSQEEIRRSGWVWLDRRELEGKSVEIYLSPRKALGRGRLRVERDKHWRKGADLGPGERGHVRDEPHPSPPAPRRRSSAAAGASSCRRRRPPAARPGRGRGRACSSGWHRPPRRRCWASPRRSAAAPGSSARRRSPSPRAAGSRPCCPSATARSRSGRCGSGRPAERHVELALHGLGLADLLAGQALAVEHVEEVGVAAGVELVGGVDLHAALGEAAAPACGG